MNIDFEKMQGLVPAIVQDAANGDVLMLGFMNSDAWEKTASSGYVTFYSRTRSPAATGCVDPAPGFTNAAPSCEFDDIVVMISSSALITRMVAAGRLP